MSYDKINSKQFKKVVMSVQTIIKEGNVHSFSIRQNAATYTLRLAHTPKGLWVCIEESFSQWKITITNELIDQTVTKASGGNQTLSYKDFLTNLVNAINKQSESWSVGIMTAVQLQLLRGGNASKQANSSKLYLILSSKQKKLHFPFTLCLSEMWQRQKLMDAIGKMKQQLDDLKTQRIEKTHSSFSIMSQTMNLGEQMKLQNQQLKRKIKIYQQSLTQKRGAVEIDMILKQKNMYEIRAETKRRQENKEIVRLRGIFQLMQKENNEIGHEIEFINKEMMLLEDSMSNPAKLKSHAMRVLKGYEGELRMSKKVTQKQVKQIQNLKRNIMNSKNIEKRHMAKIKQLQQEIQQAKKKTNIKEISNRLYSNGPNSRQASSVASNSDKAPSQTSSNAKPKSYSSSKSGASGKNLVRVNLLKKTSDLQATKTKNHLLRTSPNIIQGGTPTAQRKSNEMKPPVRPVVSSQVRSKQQVLNMRNKSAGKSEHSWNGREMKKREFTPEEKEKQKATMARLAGGKVYKEPSQEKIITRQNSRTKPIEPKRQLGASLNSKGKTPSTTNNNPNPKDILRKMKQVKQYYNSKAMINAETSKAISAKIAQVTDKK